MCLGDFYPIRSSRIRSYSCAGSRTACFY